MVPEIRIFIKLASGIALCFGAVAAYGFNSDGETDIVWQNTQRNEIAVWFLDEARFQSSGRITNDFEQGWRAVAAADFNRDGRMDLLWRSQSKGHNAIWLMNGTNRIAKQTITTGSPNFHVVGTGDFNADGYADILWHDSTNELSAVWFMSGTNWSGTVGWIPRSSGPNWQPAVTGDFNNDGNADIVWRNIENGRNAIWYLTGTNLSTVSEIQAEPNLGFQLVGTGSFNRLGNTDLIWRHSDGRNKVWIMNGSTLLKSIALPSETNRNWVIAGTGGYTNTMLLNVQSRAASNTLEFSWRHGSNRPLRIHRRILGESRWSLLATNYIPRKFRDDGIVAGRRYEYRVGKEYLLTGIRVSPVEYRGKVILILEQSIETKLRSELDRLTADLVGDGWSVIWTTAPRHNDKFWSANANAIESIRSFVRETYALDPKNTRAVLLIGHVPIPYSGYHNPDGHGFRALPADGIYGDVDGIFTDSTINTRSRLQGPHFKRHDNHIGDGKFDQNRFPQNSKGLAGLELAVGRIDFANLPAFKRVSEEELIRRYLSKTHKWRHREFSLPARVSAGTFFPTGKKGNTYVHALRLGSRLFGVAPGKTIDTDPFDPSTPSVWGIHAGWGLPYGIMGRSGRYHEAQDLVDLDRAPRFSFGSVFGSYCVDWDYTNSLMRSFLGTPTYGLAVTWFKPLPIDTVPLSFEPLGMGEPIGAGFLRSINQNANQSAPNTFVALMGDPTLRLQMVKAPNALSVQSGSKVTLNWHAPDEPNTSYYVYRSRNQLTGPWTRLTPVPITTTQFTDHSPPAKFKTYQVRSVNLTTTGSGSFTNLSQGIFVSTE